MLYDRVVNSVEEGRIESPRDISSDQREQLDADRAHDAPVAAGIVGALTRPTATSLTASAVKRMPKAPQTVAGGQRSATAGP